MAVVWHAEATVDRQSQQRLADDLQKALALEPSAVQLGGVGRARRTIAHEIDASRWEVIVSARALLELARLRFRGGELERAEVDLETAMASLRRDPVLHGAARLAHEIAMLRARIAWTRGNLEASRLAILDALILDPYARVSTRTVPPDFAAEVSLVQEELLAGASTWPLWGPPGDPARDDGFEIEIDGQEGLRPVPPGSHFVVVRRLGVAPAGAIVHTSDPLDALLDFPAHEVLGETLRGRGDAETICDRLGVDALLLAALRDDRWGLQTYACGRGFSAPLFVATAGLVATLPAVFGGPFETAVVGLYGVWPEPPAPKPRATVALAPVEVDAPPRPWYRRAWPWAVLGTLVVVGATTGIILGTRPDPPLRVEIPGPEFIDP